MHATLSRRALVPVLLVALLSALAVRDADPAGAAATYTVSTTGSDANPGTPDRPFRTITHALAALRPGDTLLVRGGDYAERVILTVAPGTSSAPVTVRAYPGERPVVRGLFWVEGASWWTFDGINVTWGQGSSNEHMVRFRGGQNWRFTNGEVWGARSFAGVLVTRGATAWTLDHNYIHDTVPTNDINQDHLIYVDATAGDGVIERNVLEGSPNGRAVKLGPPSATTVSAGAVVIRYNTMYDNRGPSNVQLSYSTRDTRIYRNIMVGSGSGQQNVTEYNLNGANNLVYENVGWESTAVVEAGKPGLVDGGGNLHRNPLLVAPGSGDVRPLDAISMAYGALAGVTTTTPTTSTTAPPSTTTAPPSTTTSTTAPAISGPGPRVPRTNHDGSRRTKTTLASTACPGIDTAPYRFADVATTSVHVDSVDCLAHWGIASGTTPTSFEPTGSVSRAQMATLLDALVAEAGGASATDVPDAFDDDDGSVHEGAVNRLAALGIVDGRADGSFAPRDVVRREQMASFLVRVLTRLRAEELAPGADVFSDDENSVHEQAINTAAAAGLLSGTAPGTYAPGDVVRREQMATFVVQLLGTLVNGGVISARTI